MVEHYLDMVVVGGSIPLAPTNILRDTAATGGVYFESTAPFAEQLSHEPRMKNASQGSPDGQVRGGGPVPVRSAPAAPAFVTAS